MPASLSALTICVHYSGYLSACLKNRDHFDRWIVVTTPDDQLTQDICQSSGIEVLLTTSLTPFSQGFNAAHNKSRLINEGLEAIEKNSYVCILDADTLLPSDFRPRFENLVKQGAIEPGTLYGSNSRRLCQSSLIFTRYQDYPPWESAPIERHRSIVGYFNLFHLGSAPNRYPASDGHDHDDWNFFEEFPLERKKFLPICCLHLGETRKNWAGNVSEHRYKSETNAQLPQKPQFKFLSETSSILICGYWSSEMIRQIAIIFDKVVLLDRWGIENSAEYVEEVENLNSYRNGWTLPIDKNLLDIDRTLIRERFWSEMPSNVTRIDNISDYSGKRFDTLFLNGDLGFDWLLHHSPHWEACLQSTEWISGNLYGFSQAPEWTAAINAVLGPPEINQNGIWATNRPTHPLINQEKSFPLPLPFTLPPLSFRLRSRAEQESKIYPDKRTGCILRIGEDPDLKLIAFTLNSIREHWNGTAASIQLLANDPTVQILSACYRIPFCSVPHGTQVRHKSDWIVIPDLPPEDLNEKICDLSPFRKTIWLEPGDIAPHNFDEAKSDIASTLLEELWDDYQVQTLPSLCTPTKVCKGAIVVYPLEQADEDEFLEKWQATRYESGQRVVILAIDYPGPNMDEYNFPENTEVISMSEFDSEDGLTDSSLWARLTHASLQFCSTSSDSHVIFVDPYLHPGLGGDLFASPQFASCDLAYPGWAFMRVQNLHQQLAEEMSAFFPVSDKTSGLDQWVTGNIVKFHKIGEPITLFRLGFLREAMEIYSSHFKGFSFELFISLTASALNCKTKTFNLRAMGWNI